VRVAYICTFMGSAHCSRRRKAVSMLSSDVIRRWHQKIKSFRICAPGPLSSSSEESAMPLEAVAIALVDMRYNTTERECQRAHTGAVLRDLTSYRRAVFARASKENIKRKAIHAKKTAFKTVH